MPDWVSISQKMERRIAPLRARWHRMEADLDQKCGREEQYTIPEAAVFWGRDKKTVERWAREGQIASSNRGQRKTRISREQMLVKQWELRGEPTVPNLFLSLPESAKGTSRADKGT
jgi:hypothetical protein